MLFELYTKYLTTTVTTVIITIMYCVSDYVSTLLYRVNCEESISTLKFADRAKQVRSIVIDYTTLLLNNEIVKLSNIFQVMVQAILNETRPIDHAFVKRLQQEVSRYSRNDRNC